MYYKLGSRNFIFQKNQYRLFLVVLFLSLSLLNSYGQKYSFTEYSIKDGLPHASVSVLFQDSRGLIWIGTQGGGLCQYDGYSFYTLSDDEGFNSSDVNSIVED